MKDYLKEMEEHKWEDELVRGKRGVLENTISNYVLYLENEPKYKGKLKYNEYLREKEYDGGEYSDFIMHRIYTDISEYFYTCNRSNADTAISNVFDKNRYNPVVDYIRGLEWDGKKRIENLFIDLLEADDTELTREMSRKWMIAAVKRTLDPGCKFDNMIVLQGGQGIGKTTICEKLSNHFFSTISLDEIGNKDLVDKLNKTWIAIIDEMDTFNKKEMSTIKTFLSLCEDRARLAYARNTSNFKRHCVFIGSTNDDTFLRDNTSSVERRFWVIKCNKTVKDSRVSDTMTPEFVDQLWAEAYHYYMENPNQYLDISSSLMDEFAKSQEKFKKENSFVEALLYELDSEFDINPYGEVTKLEQLTGYSSGPKYKINRIPMVILRKYIKDKYHEDGRYATNIKNNPKLKDWTIKACRYKSLGGKLINSLVRNIEITDSGTKKVDDPLEEFTKYL